MILDKDICKEGNLVLKAHAKECNIPLIEDDVKALENMYSYLILSTNEELAKQYKIRPGVGMAAPQIGVSKRMFCMHCEDFLDNNTVYSYALVNPQIVGVSKEMTYLPGGEGCLSVNRNTDGFVVPRHYAIKFKAYAYDFKTNKVKFITKELRGYPAIVFQHEYDHLDGILYVDKMVKLADCEAMPLYTISEENDDDNN